MRRIATAVLQRAGHLVTAVEDGRAAVTAAERADVDVMLMDVQMPIMDGLTATRLIREAERVRGGHIPIIALTAYSRADERTRGLAAGLDGYVEKPFDAGILLAEIEAVVLRHDVRRRCGCGTGADREVSVFDRTVLLDRIGGDEALMRELVELFADDLPARRRALDESVAADDREVLGRTAHALRGALLSLAAVPAAAAAHALERAAGTAETVPAAAALRCELDRLQSALAAWSRSS